MRKFTFHVSRFTRGDDTMTQTVDARGLSCPQPVILTRDAIRTGQFPIEVLVETVTSRENVRRAAEKQGLKVQVTETQGEFKLTITR
jgi:TusA-related sulfurtransferase